MRIISQSGLLDAPYELIAISPYSGNMATIVGTFPGNDLGNVQPNYWVLPKVFQFPKDEEVQI